jgi:hypothetical protein
MERPQRRERRRGGACTKRLQRREGHQGGAGMERRRGESGIERRRSSRLAASLRGTATLAEGVQAFFLLRLGTME